MTRRGPKRLVTTELLAKMREDLNKGLPLEFVLMKRGISRSTWFRALKRLGAK